MTEEEYCIVSNLARLRVISDQLRQLHECDQVTQGETVALANMVNDATEKHEVAVEEMMA